VLQLASGRRAKEGKGRETRQGGRIGGARDGEGQVEWKWFEQQREVTGERSRRAESREQRAESRAESREVQTMPDTDADGLLR
jgi:hypothetical protein